MNWGNLPKKFAAGLLGLALIFNLSSAHAEESPPKNSTENVADKPAEPERKIVINSASRILTLYEGNKKLAMYPLGLGKTSTPTPTGYYKILEKATNPTWIDPSDPEYEIPSGPNNPLGYRWMQIQGNYGIHGTNKPDSIGYYVSNGCIRMNEKDVEELYDAVEVNTPVEITYNRIVVEKADDDNVVYYIYPDGYGWQKVEIADVLRWIEPYGVAPFVSDSEIAEKIQASDGEPTYIGKPYNIELNGKVLKQIELNGRIFLSRAVVRDTITYLPVVPIAVALNTKIEWRASESTLKTAYGEVTGYERKKQIYCNADDAVILFNIDGGLQSNNNGGKIFRLKTITPPTIENPEPTIDKPVDEPKPNDVNKPADKPKTDNIDKPVENKKTDKPSNDRKSDNTNKPSNNNNSGEIDEPIDDKKPVEMVDRPFEDQKSNGTRKNNSGTHLSRGRI